MSNLQKYHVSKNLFDYVAYFDGEFIPYNVYFDYGVLQLQPNTTYTLSTSYEEYTSASIRVTALIVTTSSITPTTSGGGLSDISPKTLTTEADGIIKLYRRISGGQEYICPTKQQFDNGEWIMLNTGLTVLPYEPYSADVWHDLSPKQYVNSEFVDNANIPEKYSGGSWG